MDGENKIEAASHLLEGIAGDKGPVADVALGFESEFEGLRRGKRSDVLNYLVVFCSLGLVLARSHLLLAHDERGGSTVGEEGGVGGGVGSVGLDEGGVQAGDLLVGGGLDAVLGVGAVEGHDLSVVPVLLVGLGSVAVRSDGEVVHILAGDAELGGQAVGGHSHDLSGGVVGNGGGLRGEVSGLQALEQAGDSGGALLHGLGGSDELLADLAAAPRRVRVTN